MSHAVIQSDGASEPNPGPGGWGAVLVNAGHSKEISGGSRWTTSNQTEFSAAKEALGSLTKTCEIDFHTDTRYLQRGITDWIAK